MLSDKVLLDGLISFCCRLDGTVQQVHLVDEQIAEDSGAVANHIDAWSAELCQRDKLHLVHTSQGVWHWASSDERKHLGQALAIGLDVVSAPKSEGDGLGKLSLLFRQGLKQAIHNDECNVCGCLRWDGVRVQCVHVLPCWEYVWIANGISARTWLDELAIKSFHKAGNLIVADNFSKASLEILEERLEIILIDVWKTLLFQGLLPGGAAREEGEHVSHDGVHRLHAALLIR
mmetsp:Transcript_61007/g.108459  ORF Transcript_61007/g.108459 Transcript_61007/m.108459 type:complete len:232 (-) Transcript_61007:3020-3715(-)